MQHETSLTGTAPLPLAGLAARLTRRDRLIPLGLGLAAVFIYTWNLAVSGYANTYYSAAAQAASQSWSALFFGSLDAAGFITLDKPPLATWLMGLSVRLFGLSELSILLPQALAGVATMLVLYVTVRRSFGTAAATIASFVMLLTPVAALMFRYNNPDALLTLLLVSGAWALVRGLEDDRLRWPILAAGLIGLAFLAKFLQAYLVLPAFALTWAVAGPGSMRRRLAGLVASAATVVVTSGWWVAIIELIPAGSRPYIGGSQTNSALELLLGYDGLGRIFGMFPGGGPAPGGTGGGFGGPGAGGSPFGGEPGLLRLFNDELAGQISWLLPLACLALVAGLTLRRRAPRTDRVRAGYLLWGTWLATHAIVFSLMSGIIHPYYTVAMAPAISALVGAGIVSLVDAHRRGAIGGPVLAAGLVASAAWGWTMLERTPSFAPGLGIAALALALAAGLVLAIPHRLVPLAWSRGAVVVGLGAVLVGPALYTADTMQTAFAGGDPKAGPSASGFAGPGGGPGAPGSGSSTDPALVEYLVAQHGDAAWIVAVDSANTAAPIQLATGEPVMAMGGFSGSDPTPTLAELQGYVRSGELRFVLVGGFGGRGGPGAFGPGGVAGGTSGRTAWVVDACTPVDLGGVTGLYDCAGAA
jgi:4-amino-4-deoxy-L-arabinose transferase-like glycosyltransferase